MIGADSLRGIRQFCVSYRGLIGLLLALVSIVVLAFNARLPSLQDVLEHVSYQALAIAFILSALTTVAKAARWRELYPASQRIDFGLSIAGIAIGQLVNWAFPARLGEFVRVGLVAPDRDADVAKGTVTAAGVVGAEKLVDSAMLLIAVATLGLAGDLPVWLSRLSLVATGLACVAVMVVAVLFRARAHEALLSRVSSWPYFAKVVASASRFAGFVGDAVAGWLRPQAAARVAFWSAISWAIGALINHVVLDAVGLPSGLGISLAVLVAIYGGAAIPSVPGRIGIFQYLCILALTPFGVDFARALAFSIALYAAVYLPTVVIGLLSMLLLRPRKLPQFLRR